VCTFFSENGHSHHLPQIESRVGSVDLDVEPELSALGAEERGARTCLKSISLSNFWPIKPATGVDAIIAKKKNIKNVSGCVVNGTRYAEGSAMSSSTLCEYCYCVRGKQQCVKPQCEMPLKGCTPKYRALTCCPVSYDCCETNRFFLSETHILVLTFNFSHEQRGAISRASNKWLSQISPNIHRTASRMRLLWEIAMYSFNGSFISQIPTNLVWFPRRPLRTSRRGASSKETTTKTACR
jgi:hypothetical protein